MRTSFLILAAVVLLAANTLIYKEVLAPATLTVHVLEAGKGDAILVQTQNDKTLLVDTGSDASILRSVGTALPFWQRNIDEVILTSTKAAQVGGLASLIGRYRVGKILHVGTDELPYGSVLSVYGVRLAFALPGEIDVITNSNTIAVSSSTAPGVYTFPIK